MTFFLKNRLNLVEISLNTNSIGRSIQGGNRIVVFGIVFLGHLPQMINIGLLLALFERNHQLLLVFVRLRFVLFFFFDVNWGPFLVDWQHFIQNSRGIRLLLLILFLPPFSNFFDYIQLLIRLFLHYLSNLAPLSRKISVPDYFGVKMSHIYYWVHLSLRAIVFGGSPNLMKVKYTLHRFHFTVTFTVSLTNVPFFRVFQHLFQLTR